MKVYTIKDTYPHSNRNSYIWVTYRHKKDAVAHKKYLEKNDLTLVGRLEVGSLIIHEKYIKEDWPITIGKTIVLFRRDKR